MEKLEKGEILLAMGNEDVPVGQYTQKVLAFYGLDEEALAKAGCITYGSNVKEVTTQVDQAGVGCGVIYGTDAYRPADHRRRCNEGNVRSDHLPCRSAEHKRTQRRSGGVPGVSAKR